MCVVILCAVTQILERLQWLFAHKLDTLSYRFVGCLTILYQLSGLFGFVGNGIAIVNMQVNPEFSAEMLVHLLGVHEGLQYQKSSTKRLSSLSFFFLRISSVFVITFRCSFSYGVTAFSFSYPCCLLFANDVTIRKCSVHCEVVTLWLKKRNMNKSTDFPFSLFLYMYFYLSVLSAIFSPPSFHPLLYIKTF